MLKRVHRDVLLLMASRGVRAFAFSYLNVVFAIYLDKLGYPTVIIGVVFSVAYISGALLTAVWGFLSDRYGRKKILILLAILTIVSNSIYIFSSHLIFVLLAVVVANVGAGGSAGGGQGGGPFNPVEQALLAEKCGPEERNQVFSTNSFVGSVMGSLGALVSGLPEYLQEQWGWNPIPSYKPLFALTILFSVALIFVYAMIAEEHRPRETEKRISKKSSSFITKMSLLGVVDNLGAGMLGPLISYWFFLRYGVELKALGLLFSLSYLLAAISFLVAPIIARHIGIVRTMAFSHGAASLLYLILPFSPTFLIAASIMVLRSFTAYMDNPLRESFTMAMVKSEERGSAAGVTHLARVIPFGISPTISAYMMQSLSLNIPLVIGASLQLAHDFTFYYLFRHVRPPEEERLKG
jgi:MFS family permease